MAHHNFDAGRWEASTQLLRISVRCEPIRFSALRVAGLILLSCADLRQLAGNEVLEPRKPAKDGTVTTRLRF